MTAGGWSTLRGSALCAGLLLGIAPAVAQDDFPVGTVTAAVETQPVKQDPDDPAIWVHPTDPTKSLVLGTDKDFGLVVDEDLQDDDRLFVTLRMGEFAGLDQILRELGG